MKTTERADTVTFSVKGQVVIPRRLRREFGIEEGTRAVVTETSEGILLKPVTRRAIASLYGVLKPGPGGKPLREWWVEHKREEKALEESKHARHGLR